MERTVNVNIAAFMSFAEAFFATFAENGRLESYHRDEGIPVSIN